MRFFSRALLLTALSFCLQCSVSSPLKITVNPEAPVVIGVDFSYTDSSGNPGTAKKNWFKFKIVVTNESTSTITLLSLNLEVQNGKDKALCEIDSGTVGNTQYIAEMAGGTTATPTATFYCDGLFPESTNYSYTVTLKAVGWYGTYADPQGRVTSVTGFSAR